MTDTFQALADVRTPHRKHALNMPSLQMLLGDGVALALCVGPGTLDILGYLPAPQEVLRTHGSSMFFLQFSSLTPPFKSAAHRGVKLSREATLSRRSSSESWPNVGGDGYGPEAPATNE